MDYECWQRRWDLQQEGYMPDREARFVAMFDVVEAACGRSPRVLDLAGGTGSITRRLLVRFPASQSVLVDVDPVLLALASGTFEGDRRVRVVSADLSDPAWAESVAGEGFDAILTATALHWLEPERVRALYGEAHRLLVPGGVFVNVDHMDDEGLSPLHEAFGSIAAERTEKVRAATGALDWAEWWDEIAADPEMAELVEARARTFGPGGSQSHSRSILPSSWHIDAIRAAGYGSAGLAWRNLSDALVVGVV